MAQKTIRQRIDGPALHRAAKVDSFDDEARTVRLSFSSDEPYLRASYFEDPWIEVLGHEKGEVDMSRFDAGAVPVLYGHNTYDRDDHVGVVDKAWLKDGRGYADIRISKRDGLEGLWQDVRDGILRNVSVGYQIHERTLVKEHKDGPNEYRVTRWLPMEVSLVPIPADASVGVGRSAEAPARFTVTTLPTEEKSMDEDEQNTAGKATTERDSAAPTTTTPEALDLAKKDGEGSERRRVSEINDIATRANLTPEQVKPFIVGGQSIDKFREFALEELAKRDTTNRPSMRAGMDQAEKENEAIVLSLLSRAGQRDEAGKPINLQGNQFRGVSLMDLAKRSLQRAGVNFSGLMPMEIVGRAITHSTSDFPILLQTVLNKQLLAAYSIVPDTWRMLAKVGSVGNFLPHYRYHAGSFSDLETVYEGGEYKYGTLTDGEKNTIAATTKGKMIGITRQLIINDDIGAISDIATHMGRSAARSIEKDFYVLLNSNPVMGDGVALFHATHGNLTASGTAPSMASILLELQTMEQQQYAGEYVDIRAAIALAGIVYAGNIATLNAAQYDPADNKFLKMNEVRGRFREVVASPRVTGNAWYVFADPNVEPVFEVVFLNGMQTPYLESRQGWSVDGVEWKVRLDYGIGAVGYRGARKNPGP